MDIAEKVFETLESFKDGDCKFDVGDYKDSVRSYEKAIELSRSLPRSEEFDHLGFEASCYAGLSGALGRLGKHCESLVAAEAALAFFDRCGEMYPAEIGKWLMAIVNRGSALARLGSPDKALDEFLRAKRMLCDREMDDITENQHWIAMVDQNIRSVQAMLNHIKTKSKPWWKFW